MYFLFFFKSLPLSLECTECFNDGDISCPGSVQKNCTNEEKCFGVISRANLSIGKWINFYVHLFCYVDLDDMDISISMILWFHIRPCFSNVTIFRLVDFSSENFEKHWSKVCLGMCRYLGVFGCIKIPFSPLWWSMSSSVSGPLLRAFNTRLGTCDNYFRVSEELPRKGEAEMLELYQKTGWEIMDLNYQKQNLMDTRYSFLMVGTIQEWKSLSW